MRKLFQRDDDDNVVQPINSVLRLATRSRFINVFKQSCFIQFKNILNIYNTINQEYVLLNVHKGCSSCVCTQCHENVWWSRSTVPCAPNTETRWKYVVTFLSKLIYPNKRCGIDTQWIEDWMGPRASLDMVASRKISGVSLTLIGPVLNVTFVFFFTGMGKSTSSSSSDSGRPGTSIQK